MAEKKDEILKKLEKGELKIYEIEKLVQDANEASKIRRAFVEKKWGKSLQHVGETSIDFNDALNRNIENPIGATQVPLGYAGELKIKGDYAKGDYPVLLATTEGKLVAGISRGISTLNKNGGVDVSILKDGMARDILVRVARVKEAAKLIKWIESAEGFKFLKTAFSESTKHGKLIEVKAYAAGRDVHIRFRANTGAAMGMNMVTIASKSSVEKLIEEAHKTLGFKVTLISESGNMCADKKPAYIDIVEGRGVSLIADALIPRKIIEERFGVQPEAMVELNKAKNLIGSALAGAHGFNAQVANILAAMYIAHGQDAAQIVEGSQTLTDVSITDDNLYISIFMPAIEVGTYGGGTKRETQKEALSLLGMYGENDAEGKTRLAFAELVAGTCLAGELNLIAAEASLTLAKSHSQLKR